MLKGVDNLCYSLIASAKSGVQDWSLVETRRKPLSCGFFTRKFSVLHLYVGLGKALFGGAGNVFPVDQPCSVRLHDWSHVVGFRNFKHEVIMSKSNVAHLRPKHNKSPFQVPVLSHSINREEVILALPEFLDAAISYILSDFDYSNNTDSNTAVAVRILATMSDRLNTSMEQCHE